MNMNPYGVRNLNKLLGAEGGGEDLHFPHVKVWNIHLSYTPRGAVRGVHEGLIN